MSAVKGEGGGGVGVRNLTASVDVYVRISVHDTNLDKGWWTKKNEWIERRLNRGFAGRNSQNLNCYWNLLCAMTVELTFENVVDICVYIYVIICIYINVYINV